MNDNILIRTINENEWEEAMNLAWDTFILYEAPEYTKEGITSFRNFVRDPILKTLFIEGKYNVNTLELLINDNGKWYIAYITKNQRIDVPISVSLIKEKYRCLEEKLKVVVGQ